MLNNIKSISVNARLLSAIAVAPTLQEGREYLRSVYVREHSEGGIELCATNGHVMFFGHDPNGEVDIIDKNKQACIFKFHVSDDGKVSRAANDILLKVQRIAKKEGARSVRKSEVSNHRLKGNVQVHLSQSPVDHILTLEAEGNVDTLDVSSGMGKCCYETSKLGDCAFAVMASASNYLKGKEYDTRLDGDGYLPFFLHGTISKVAEMQSCMPGVGVAFAMRGVKNDKGKVMESTAATILFSPSYGEDWRLFGVIMACRNGDGNVGEIDSLEYEKYLVNRHLKENKRASATREA